MANLAVRLMVLLLPLSALADTPSEAKLQQQLTEIRQELDALKAKQGTPPAKTGLKTEDLKGRTVSSQNLAPAANAASAGGGLDQAIPPEMMKQLQDSLGKLQKGQAEQTQFMQEIERDIK